ncbi:MAG: Crp/Fnr family transcriptional regulator [Bacteroidota bacterium]
MKPNTLSTFLTSNIDLKEAFLQLLFSSCQIKQVNKGDYLLQPGETCTHSFFVKKGLLRQFSLDAKGKEHVLQFAPENWFMSDRDSVFFHEPAAYYIQALENTSVYLIDEPFLTNLAHKDPQFLDFNLNLLHKHIRQLHKRVQLLLSATAEERYLDFVHMYPDLMLRVPQIQIASYLGITPESLSRVRSDLAKKNQGR